MINIEITNGDDVGSYTFTENASRLLTKMGAGNVKSAFALKGVINMVMSHLIAKGQITDLDNLSELRSHLEDGAQFTINILNFKKKGNQIKPAQ